MDFKAICTNLAAQYATGTLATPAGADPIRKVFGQAPTGPYPTPFLVVLPSDGSRTYGDAQWMDQLHLKVHVYFSKHTGDLSRVETQRQLWLPSLLAATHPNMAIDLQPTVLKAIPTGWEFRELPYDADDYDGIVIDVTVFTREYGTFTP